VEKTFNLELTKLVGLSNMVTHSLGIIEKDRALSYGNVDMTIATDP
jgi:hypothetical protein